MKVCRNCFESKPYSEFYRAAKNRDFLRHTCKDCCKAEAREYRAALSEDEKEDLKEKIQEWKEDNPESVKLSAKKWRDKMRGI